MTGVNLFTAVNDALASYLRRLRKSGYTQARFANDVGVSEAAVSYWLSTDRTPDLSTALRIAEVTNGAVPVTAWARQRRSRKARRPT